MAGRASPLSVRVAPADKAAERVMAKLKIHFQSQKKSGGGECDVRARDRARGLYEVWFLSEEVKNRVKAQKAHSIEVEGKTLEINILPNSEVSTAGPGERSLTNNGISSVANSLSASSAVSLPNDLERELGGKSAGDLDNITRKIFLSVSATLNTDLLTKEERDQVTVVCPTLKVDVHSRWLGIEKVSGDYCDIQKLHSHFEKLFGNSYQHGSSFLHPEGQNHLEERDVEMENLEEKKSKDDSEDTSNMDVPSAIFEYFSRVCKEQVEELEQTFNVKLTWNECGNGLTSVRFASLGASNSTDKAQHNFVTAFQKIASIVKQERIPFTDRFHFAKARELLGTQYKNLLVKTDGRALILRGPAGEISAAKEFIEKIKDLDKNPKAQCPESGIEVDANTFNILRPILAKDIHAINQKYATEIDVKPSLKNENLLIFFKPKNTYSNECPNAYHNFILVYRKALASPIEKRITLNHSEDKKKLLNEFFQKLQMENPRISLQKNGDQLVVCGLPEEVSKSEKHIMMFLESSVKPSPKSVGSSIPASSSGATLGAPFEQNSAHKMYSHLPQENSDVKATGVEQEEQCAICMDKIHQKEVLPKCKHEFCRECIKEAMRHKPACPVCNTFYGKIEGNQPPGKMDISKSRTSLPGYEGSGTITISYQIPDGFQTEDHPNPGRRFSGTCRFAYLPDNREGREILSLLRRAFDQKLVFTVGQSRTSGLNDVVTWNDIHHKTCIYGGPNNFGYPDPHYLKRVREELKAKGIE